MKTPAFRLPALAAALALVLAGPVLSDGKPRLYLAWHAPYGAPRASDTLLVRCGDGGRDTLFLTFETAANWPTFCGVASQLYFRAPAGDTLAPQLLEDRNIEVEFVTDSIPGYRRMWRGTQSLRYSYLDYTRGSCSLRLSSVRPPTLPVRMQDSVRYTLARVMVAHPPADLPGCDQPLCVEWVKAQFLTDSTGETTVMSGQGGRPFASMNSRGGQVCESFLPAEMPGAPKPRAEQARNRSKRRPRPGK